MSSYKIKLLSNTEVIKHYLPLRFCVLHQELGWTSSKVSSYHDLLDEHDAMSESFGVFLNENMVAGVRLIESAHLRDLPTGVFVRQLRTSWEQSNFGEISRIMVGPQYRGHHIVPILIRRTLAAAKQRNIENVLISVPHKPEYSAMLGGIGFELLRSGFKFRDSKIAPKGESAAYRLAARSLLFSHNSNEQVSQVEHLISKLPLK